jgi:transcriptional regulator with XRE-family HTH domain
MYAASELSHLVKTRRSDMGLTQTQVSSLSGLSRATVNQLENGTLKDLSLTRIANLLGALGLSVTFSPARPKRASEPGRMSAVERAAKSASVSFNAVLKPQQLAQAIATGTPPAGFEPHVNATLEDASIHLLSEMVEEVHARSHVERAVLWSNLRKMAGLLGSRRALWGSHEASSGKRSS